MLCFPVLFCKSDVSRIGGVFALLPQNKRNLPQDKQILYILCSSSAVNKKPKYGSKPCSPKDMVLCCVRLIKAMKKEVFEYPMPSISAAAVAAAPKYHPLPSIAQRAIALSRALLQAVQQLSRTRLRLQRFEALPRE